MSRRSDSFSAQDGHQLKVTEWSLFFHAGRSRSKVDLELGQKDSRTPYVDFWSPLCQKLKFAVT